MAASPARTSSRRNILLRALAALDAFGTAAVAGLAVQSLFVIPPEILLRRPVAPELTSAILMLIAAGGVLIGLGILGQGHWLPRRACLEPRESRTLLFLGGLTGGAGVCTLAGVLVAGQSIPTPVPWTSPALLSSVTLGGLFLLLSLLALGLALSMPVHRSTDGSITTGVSGKAYQRPALLTAAGVILLATLPPLFLALVIMAPVRQAAIVTTEALDALATSLSDQKAILSVAMATEAISHDRLGAQSSLTPLPPASDGTMQARITLDLSRIDCPTLLALQASRQTYGTSIRTMLDIARSRATLSARQQQRLRDAQRQAEEAVRPDWTSLPVLACIHGLNGPVTVTRIKPFQVQISREDGTVIGVDAYSPLRFPGDPRG